MEIAVVYPKKERDFPGSLTVRFSVASSLEILSWWLQEPSPPSVKVLAGYMERLVVRPTIEK